MQISELGFVAALCASTCLVLTSSEPLSAQQGDLLATPPVVSDALVRSDGLLNERFGTSVAVSGDTAVIGAPGQSVDGVQNHGAAYVFERRGERWTEVAQLRASDSVQGDYVGYDVAIEGDTIVVGAPHYNQSTVPGTGAVYVFKKPAGGWIDMTESQKLEPISSSLQNGDHFGVAVDISGEYLVVGAPEDDQSGYFEMGSAYIFRNFSGLWFEVEKLFSPDITSKDFFGFAVAIEDNVVVVGERYGEGAVTDSGAVHVFTGSSSSWSAVATLTASDGAQWDGLGSTVALSGGTVVAGAPGDDYSVQPDYGSVYVFEKPVGGWTNMTETARLEASDGLIDNKMGQVAILGDLIAVGVDLADLDDPAPGHGWWQDAGALYLFQKPPAGWSSTTEGLKVVSPDPDTWAYFGRGLCIDGSKILVGSPGAYKGNFAKVGLVRELSLGGLFHDGFESGDGSAWTTN